MSPTTPNRNRQNAVTRAVMKVFTPFHSWILRASKGRIGQGWSTTRQPIVLLTTTGRRSGAPRTTVVGYHEDGPNLVVIASKGGLPEHPAWYHNLVANPQVTVELNDTRRSMRARVAEGEERERLWKTIAASYPQFNDYQSRISRRIPIVVLEPTA